MLKYNYLKIFIVLLSILSLNSCLKDLDTVPPYGLNSETVYGDPANYKNVLAKMYAGLTITGNNGPAGSPDISTSTIDEGSSQYTRVLWNLQELPTDEAVCGWGDPGIPELNKLNWSSETVWIKGMYYRIYYQITLCNEFLRQSTDAKMTKRGFSDADKATINSYRNEARFLRALSYYHQLDLFGKGPFTTEDNLGADLPVEASSAQLFSFVESELLAIENQIAAPRSNEYGRADRAAVWTLLSKLYLNANVYVGQNKYTEAATYAKKVIDAGYALESNYSYLFLADNHLSNEIIFPVTSDGTRTQTYGGTTFLIHAAIGGTMNAADFGVAGGWVGIRAKKSLAYSFGDTINDSRFLFHHPRDSADIVQINNFKHGFGVTKWKNVDRNGVKGSDPTGTYADTDFPMFRLADVYLMYAEAVLRGGTGDLTLATSLVNQIRERAYGNSNGNVSNIDLDFILAERGRELYWEGQRRTDLRRFGKFTGGSYLWEWKGGTQQGTSVDDHFKVYPIPSTDINANPNLSQNDGY
ncbi:MAG: RagB/SusD family nutrient uptake outer membrane protein [Saprospiraceae bacterium]|nr:RagB/SusD family nutrient uptake outer membrane protein [Saprospiraceae bacterium]